MTVGEMLEKMGAKEFFGWQAYFARRNGKEEPKDLSKMKPEDLAKLFG